MDRTSYLLSRGFVVVFGLCKILLVVLSTNKTKSLLLEGVLLITAKNEVTACECLSKCA